MKPVLDKMEYFMVIVSGFQLFTIVTKNFIFLGFLDLFCTVINLLQKTNEGNTKARKEGIKKFFYINFQPDLNADILVFIKHKFLKNP